MSFSPLVGAQRAAADPTSPSPLLGATIPPFDTKISTIVAPQSLYEISANEEESEVEAENQKSSERTGLSF
ncbi:hypothetical protein N7478_005080 [Penicillium angulare]|uniref:uncharacterized protein n=1 Tax=Penicillium angulare TaxID=116970 RepID=UPI0025404C47|nr:uncharacterized protein N7478_005080 [Penicillium angulare]KAJ5279708.1 hypothetical protein N7478_005080 [Penicillium angulare]